MGHRGAYDRRERGGWQPTDRQREVLDLLAKGKTNAEIAVRLGITVDGAKWHVGELLSQTECDDRQALAEWWRRVRSGAGHGGVFAFLRAGWLARGALVIVASATVLAAAMMLTGGRDHAPAATSEATPTPQPGPTPWPEEALEALAASQGPPPATCEPPEAQDMRLVDAAELLAEGLEPAGRVLIDAYCPLYVANRIDRAVVWVGGGGLLYLDRSADRRLMSAYGGYASANLSLNGVNYRLAAYGWSPDWQIDGFETLEGSVAQIERTSEDGAYLMLQMREWPASTPDSLGPAHRVAFSSDGQMFLDRRPFSQDNVINDLTGEAIDVRGISALGRVRPGNTGSVRTDCSTSAGVCNVFLDGVGGEGTGIFNSATLPVPVAGVLRCVQDDGGWSIDAPALAYELDAGEFRLQISAFGGYWEAWEEECPERQVAAGEEINVWVYTYIKAFAADGTPISVVSTRDGRLFVGDVDLELDCPCEPRS